MRPLNKAVLLFMLLLVGCNQRPATLAPPDFDEKAMQQAIDRARQEVDQFINVLSSNDGSQFAVKVPIEDGDNIEHFWLTNLSYTDGEFAGVIGNEPGVVGNVSLGQKWSVKKNEISDWMYMKDGRMYGNYTIRPLLETLPPDQAAHIRSILAE